MSGWEKKSVSQHRLRAQVQLIKENTHELQP